MIEENIALLQKECEAIPIAGFNQWEQIKEIDVDVFIKSFVENIHKHLPSEIFEEECQNKLSIKYKILFNGFLFQIIEAQTINKTRQYNIYTTRHETIKDGTKLGRTNKRKYIEVRDIYLLWLLYREFFIIPTTYILTEPGPIEKPKRKRIKKAQQI